MNKKSELQLNGNSIIIAVLGITQTSKSQNDMFQWKFFQSNNSMSQPEETRTVEKIITHTLKNVQVFTLED